MTKIQLNTIEEAIEDIRQGKIIIVVDDEGRENEGDFLAAAEKVTPEMINFMANYFISLTNNKNNLLPLLEKCSHWSLENHRKTNRNQHVRIVQYLYFTN